MSSSTMKLTPLERREGPPAKVRLRANALDMAPWVVWTLGMLLLAYWAFFVLTDFRQIGAALAGAILLTFVARFASRRISAVTQRMRMSAALDHLDARPPAAARDHMPAEAVELLARLHHLVDELGEGTAREPKRAAWEWVGELSLLSDAARSHLEAAGIDIDNVERSIKAALDRPVPDLHRALADAERALAHPTASGYR
jgi:hypothetical protein